MAGKGEQVIRDLGVELIPARTADMAAGQGPMQPAARLQAAGMGAAGWKQRSAEDCMPSAHEDLEVDWSGAGVVGREDLAPGAADAAGGHTGKRMPTALVWLLPLGR